MFVRKSLEVRHLGAGTLIVFYAPKRELLFYIDRNPKIKVCNLGAGFEI